MTLIRKGMAHATFHRRSGVWEVAVLFNNQICTKREHKTVKIFANNTNLTFLSFLYKINIEVSYKKLPPVGIELTTDHYWFTSLKPIQLC